MKNTKNLFTIKLLRGTPCVSARNIHSLGQHKAPYSTWVLDLVKRKKYIENTHYKKIIIDTVNNRPKYDHLLTLETALRALPTKKHSADINIANQALAEALRETPIQKRSFIETTSLHETFKTDKYEDGTVKLTGVTSLPIQTPIEQDLKNENGQIVVSSRDVAVRFGKRHDHVIRAIVNKVCENPILGSLNYYIESEYKTDGNNKSYKEYLMTREGFTFIVMGFTGKEADSFKLAYIEAFNKMEEQLKAQTPVLPTTYKDALVALVAEVEVRERLEVENKQQLVQITEHKKEINQLKPKSAYCDMVLMAGGAVPITIIAKDYGMSATTMNRVLHKYGVQYKMGSTWVLYAKHQDKGYTSSFTGVDCETKFGDFAYVSTRWTQKGRMFIYETLKEHGMLPEMER